MHFFGLWRGSRQNTDKIDSHYRSLLASGIDGVAPEFKRQSSTGLLTSDLLQAALKHILTKEGKIEEKAVWVNLCKSNPVYSINKALTRLLLLSALHNTISDTEELGLEKLGREGINPMLNKSIWKQKSLTIEHVAPQDNENWDVNIYAKAGLYTYFREFSYHTTE